MGLTKRILTVLQACFLTVGFTLGQFAVPTGDAWAASKKEQKEERCWKRETGAATMGAACAGAIAAAKTACPAAVLTAAFDFGTMTVLCGVALGAAAVACGLTISAVTKAVKVCW